MDKKKLRLIAINKTTIDMFRTLLATNNVANNFFGLSNKVEIILLFLGFLIEYLSRSVAESEKKATSAPEISAAKSSNSRIMAKPKIAQKSSVFINCKLGGSMSKCF